MRCRLFMVLCLFTFSGGSFLIKAQERLQLVKEIDSLLYYGQYKPVLEKANGLISSDSANFIGLGYQFKGEAHGYLEEDSLAIGMFQRAEAYIPRYANLFKAKAFFFSARFMLDSAVSNYSKAIAYVSNYHDSTYIGNLIMDAAIPLKHLERFDEALDMLDRSLKYRSDNWLTYYHKADIHYMHGEADSAMWYVNKAESQEGGRNASVIFMKAGVYHMVGNQEKP